MITTLAQITSTDWSLQLDQVTSGDGLGQIVQGIDDVEQCLGIILTSPQGCDPLRPTFAVDMNQFIDKPINIAVPAMVGALADAITTWEPRITLISISARPVLTGNQAGAQMTVTIIWRLKISIDGLPVTTVITIPWGSN